MSNRWLQPHFVVYFCNNIWSLLIELFTLNTVFLIFTYLLSLSHVEPSFFWILTHFIQTSHYAENCTVSSSYLPVFIYTNTTRVDVLIDSRMSISQCASLVRRAFVVVMLYCERDICQLDMLTVQPNVQLNVHEDGLVAIKHTSGSWCETYAK